MTVCTNSRDRMRGTGRKRKREMRSEGERWLKETLIRENQKNDQCRPTLIFTQAQKILESQIYREMQCTSMGCNTVVMATQAGLRSRQVSG